MKPYGLMNCAYMYSDLLNYPHYNEPQNKVEPEFWESIALLSLLTLILVAIYIG